MSTKICIVTCYKMPDYVRAATLRQGLHDTGLFNKVIVVKNSHIGIRRYLDVIVELMKVRFGENPDIYVVTFRGYEILPFVLLIAMGKKIVYDELVNPVEWFVHEHKKFSPSSVKAKLLRSVFRAMSKRCDVIIADTNSHADYWSQLMGVDREKYVTIPVGTDETIFKRMPDKTSPKEFRILYYGSMLPLHGVDIVIKTALDMRERADVLFHLIGGGDDIALQVATARAEGAHIEYEKWVPYKELPRVFARSDLCLGGPFGDTVQSQHVITGKTYQFLASARPVIIGITKETQLFKDKKNALMVKQGDTVAVRNAIEWGYNNRDMLRTIGTEGEKLYHQHFGSVQIAADLRTLFLEKHVFKMKDAGQDK